MIDLTRIHIHCVTPEGAKGRKRFIKKIIPSQPEDNLAIQQDIGEALRPLRDSGKYEYYYVIFEIDKGGKSAFRTVTTKIMF